MRVTPAGLNPGDDATRLPEWQSERCCAEFAQNNRRYKSGRKNFQQNAEVVGWVERSEIQQSPRAGEEAIYAAVMSDFVPQPDLRGCRLGIEIEIQIEIVIRRRVGPFDLDTDFDDD